MVTCPQTPAFHRKQSELSLLHHTAPGWWEKHLQKNQNIWIHSIHDWPTGSQGELSAAVQLGVQQEQV